LATVDTLLFRLQAHGFRLLLAHPERCAWLDPGRLVGWVNRGVCVQLELGSFVGAYGLLTRNLAFRLVEQGLVHVLASDLHRPQELYDWVAGGLSSVESHFGSDVLGRAVSANPAAILSDAAVTAIPPLVKR
jgi:protein-tyrosine phosphatase